jgi:hypothetical protein
VVSQWPSTALSCSPLNSKRRMSSSPPPLSHMMSCNQAPSANLCIRATPFRKRMVPLPATRVQITLKDGRRKMISRVATMMYLVSLEDKTRGRRCPLASSTPWCSQRVNVVFYYPDHHRHHKQLLFVQICILQNMCNIS